MGFIVGSLSRKADILKRIMLGLVAAGYSGYVIGTAKSNTFYCTFLKKDVIYYFLYKFITI